MEFTRVKWVGPADSPEGPRARRNPPGPRSRTSPTLREFDLLSSITVPRGGAGAVGSRRDRALPAVGDPRPRLHRRLRPSAVGPLRRVHRVLDGLRHDRPLREPLLPRGAGGEHVPGGDVLPGDRGGALLVPGVRGRSLRSRGADPHHGGGPGRPGRALRGHGGGGVLAAGVLVGGGDPHPLLRGGSVLPAGGHRRGLGPGRAREAPPGLRDDADGPQPGLGGGTHARRDRLGGRLRLALCRRRLHQPRLVLDREAVRQRDPPAGRRSNRRRRGPGAAWMDVLDIRHDRPFVVFCGLPSWSSSPCPSGWPRSRSTPPTGSGPPPAASG